MQKEQIIINFNVKDTLNQTLVGPKFSKVIFVYLHLT